MNRFHAWRATRGDSATAFTTQPEPRTIGAYAKGRQIIGGNFLFAGFLVEAPGSSIWQLPVPSPAFEEEIHGFRWLDDLASVGDLDARQRAQDWTGEWISLHGRGHGRGWSPDLTGRRLIRWINHAIFLLNGKDSEWSHAYYRSLGHQTTFLSRRWKSAAPGLPRFEALTGLVYAGLALEGMEKHVTPAAKALAQECHLRIDAEGGLPTRNPEDLLEVFTLLNWASSALSAAGILSLREHAAAIERIAPTLRALRHADGGLARFHGGGRGAEGRLDQALANSGVKKAFTTGLAMGFARLSAGRSSVIVDAALPPGGVDSYNAHASTLAFELTSGRRPLIVSCGSGATFGAEWRRAGRATQSHSTLALHGLSSSRLASGKPVGGQSRELLVDLPVQVEQQHSAGPDGQSITAWHDGYIASHGLVHVRKLELGSDGRALSGEDTLVAFDDTQRRTFDRAMDKARLQGIGYAVHFHLHPDVDAALDMGGAAVSLGLRSGEVWVFRHDGHAEMSLEASVFLETGRLKPRATQQIVLKSRVTEYASQINWTLSKAQDTPQGVRDLQPSAAPAPDD